MMTDNFWSKRVDFRHKKLVSSFLTVQKIKYSHRIQNSFDVLLCWSVHGMLLGKLKLEQLHNIHFWCQSVNGQINRLFHFGIQIDVNIKHFSYVRNSYLSAS